jgi:hypothetical protein
LRGRDHNEHEEGTSHPAIPDDGLDDSLTASIASKSVACSQHANGPLRPDGHTGGGAWYLLSRNYKKINVLHRGIPTPQMAWPVLWMGSAQPVDGSTKVATRT